MTHRRSLLLPLVAVVALALLLPLPAVAKKKGKKKKQADPPTAQELRARYLEVTNEDAMYAQGGWTMTGTFAIPAQGITGPVLVKGTANKSYTMIEIPGIGVVEEGYDGTHAWSNDPMQGPRLKSAEETAESAFNADVGSDWGAKYEIWETQGAGEYDGRDVWRVRLVPKGGLPERTLLYDAETGLELVMITSSLTPMGEVTSTIEFADWKDHEAGFKYPGTMTSSALGMEQVLTFETIVLAPDDPASWTLPAEVQQLLEEEPAEAAPEAEPAPDAEPATAPEGAAP